MCAPPAPPSAADASGDDMETKTVQGAPAPARRRGSRERARRSRADAVYDLLPLMNGSARLAHVLMRVFIESLRARKKEREPARPWPPARLEDPPWAAATLRARRREAPARAARLADGGQVRF